MFRSCKLFLLSLSLPVLGFTINTQASELSIPNTFTAGTPAKAAEVNENFTATATSVNDLETRVTQLEALLAAMGVITGTDAQGNPVVIFSGVNVHINNGEGATNTVNGLGNLIVGYDEAMVAGPMICSDGQYDNQNDCESEGEVWAAGHRSGSHNVVIGPQHSYSRYGGLVAGFFNIVNGNSATVSGGGYNRASNTYASVSAGQQNTASGHASSVSGGMNNTASSIASSVSGGDDNLASGENASISGGGSNEASGGRSSISGGAGNTASNTYASVSGGSSNTADGGQSSVSGGYSNTASANWGSVSGGAYRTAADQADWVAGGLLEDN